MPEYIDTFRKASFNYQFLNYQVNFERENCFVDLLPNASRFHFEFDPIYAPIRQQLLQMNHNVTSLHHFQTRTVSTNWHNNFCFV